MAATASSAATSSVTNSHSPRTAGVDSTAVNSPKSRRSAARGAPSPWTQIVRGAESETITSSSSVVAAPPPSSPSSSSGAHQEQAAHSSSEWTSSVAPASSSSSSLSAEDSAAEAQAQQDNSDYGGGNSNVGRRPAWNMPSNGAVEAGSVMGAASWPALSESTRASPKSSSSESLKALSDGSIPVSQGTVIAYPSSQKQNITSNANPSSTPNHVASPRQKSTRPGGGSSSKSVLANGGLTQPPPPPLSSVVEPPNNAGKPGPVVQESTPKDHTHKETGQRGNFGSQSRGGNDHGHQRNSYRRGNGGPHPRGDGFYHHNYGNRRDHDRGNHEWNPHRGFNGRDGHMQAHRGVPRSFMRPATHSPTPIFSPPPVAVRPFGAPMVYPDMTPPVIYVPSPTPESLRGMQFVAPIPPQPLYFPVPDLQLNARIVSQIDYYFSNENLIKDTYLRRNMDDQGWVPIKLIAGFKKVSQLSESVPLILDAVRSSMIVEVQGDKVRRRNDWMRWIMPPTQFSNISNPQLSGSSSHDVLAANVQNVSLDNTTTHGHGESFLSRSSSGDSNTQPQASSGEGTSDASVQRSQHSISA